MKMPFLPTWACLRLQLSQLLPSSCWQVSLISDRQCRVNSALAAAGLCMAMPIFWVWWLIPVLRCLLQSRADIHSVQSVFPSLLSKCHFPFVAAFFSCQLYDTRRNTKNHSSKNISQGSRHHPPRSPCIWWLSSPRWSQAVTSPLFCFRAGRGRDAGWEQNTGCFTGQQTQEREGEGKQDCKLKSSGVRGSFRAVLSGSQTALDVDHSRKGTAESPAARGWFLLPQRKN